MTSLQTILPVSAAENSDGCLTISGQALRPLAEQFGTPLYIYDAATVYEQVRRLREQFQQHYPGSYEITYAAKAYFSLGMARKLAALDLGVDVVSLGEISVARKAGFAPGRVHLHGNNKSPEELAAALDWDVQAIVVDSLDELELLEALAAKAKRAPRVWLRITPGVKVGTHAYMQTAHHTSKFGLSTQGGSAAEAIHRAQKSKHLNLVGLHTHLGSNFFEAEPYQEAISGLMDLAEEMHFIPQELSPGGGWGVPYVEDQPEGEPGAWIKTVAGSIKAEYEKRGWPLPKLVVEPGRQLVARAGIALYTVGTTKTSGDGTRFVAVDGGMSDNLRPALYGARYLALLPERMHAKPTGKVNVVGKFCESGDQLIEQIPLPDVQRGDLLAIPAAGAYHLSMASNYNLAPRPAVLWLEGDQIEVFQKRERPEESAWWMGE